MTTSESTSASATVTEKPRLRGVLHQVAAVVALVAGVALTATSPSFKGALSASLAISSGIQPQFGAGTLSGSED